MPEPAPVTIATLSLSLTSISASRAEGGQNQCGRRTPSGDAISTDHRRAERASHEVHPYIRGFASEAKPQRKLNDSGRTIAGELTKRAVDLCSARIEYGPSVHERKLTMIPRVVKL